MAETEVKSKPKDLVEAVPEEVEKLEEDKEVKEEIEELERVSETHQESFEEKRERIEKEKLLSWAPKTKLGISVKTGKEKNLDKILESGRKILEPEIVDTLINLKSDLILIGQAKGKFGGGKRRAWRQTQKKTQEGNVLTFSSMSVVGDNKGYVGLGYGTSKETLPAREKSLRKAKLNIIKVVSGFETVEDGSHAPHTVPFKVEGKCGSVRITLLPAPRGTGLVVGDECKKILKLAGIKDVYGITKGHTRTTFNVAKACIEALKKTNSMVPLQEENKK
ncbi:30S ribosomal protein S5 [Candidatus Pacearchaeota archaeon]|nr:30S ribosomal protein S5 [Candidatus Pacearchaeota archaeon]|tara:strand:+ start:5364 stop:6197 length:834 start_codon:yes stop_codon:yes gene_type:complete